MDSNVSNSDSVSGWQGETAEVIEEVAVIKLPPLSVTSDIIKIEEALSELKIKYSMYNEKHLHDAIVDLESAIKSIYLIV